jgi:hypothetical protein
MHPVLTLRTDHSAERTGDTSRCVHAARLRPRAGSSRLEQSLKSRYPPSLSDCSKGADEAVHRGAHPRQPGPHLEPHAGPGAAPALGPAIHAHRLRPAGRGRASAVHLRHPRAAGSHRLGHRYQRGRAAPAGRHSNLGAAVRLRTSALPHRRRAGLLALHPGGRRRAVPHRVRLHATLGSPRPPGGPDRLPTVDGLGHPVVVRPAAAVVRAGHHARAVAAQRPCRGGRAGCGGGARGAGAPAARRRGHDRGDRPPHAADDPVEPALPAASARPGRGAAVLGRLAAR